MSKSQLNSIHEEQLIHDDDLKMDEEEMASVSVIDENWYQNHKIYQFKSTNI